jgi:predicted DNA-binding transcriptional regulator AlpA
MSDDLIRWMNATDTAKYLGVKETALNRLVRLGHVPRPSYVLGPRSPRWDRLQIDIVFENILNSSDLHRTMITKGKSDVDRILEEGRARRSLREARRNGSH